MMWFEPTGGVEKMGGGVSQGGRKTAGFRWLWCVQEGPGYITLRRWPLPVESTLFKTSSFNSYICPVKKDEAVDRFSTNLI